MKKKTDLPKLLEKEKAVPAAVRTLIECLSAVRSFNQNGVTKTEPDFAVRCKSALGLLEWAASPPPRLSAKDVAPPGPKLSEAEREQEIRRILGIEDYNDRGAVEQERIGA